MDYWVLAHLWGDYILQNDKMSKYKKTSWLWVILHGFTYISAFSPLLIIDDSVKIWQLIIIMLQHIIQDKSNFVVWFMKTTGSSNFATGICSPWSIIVVDNIIHLSFIWLIFNI